MLISPVQILPTVRLFVLFQGSNVYALFNSYKMLMSMCVTVIVMSFSILDSHCFHRSQPIFDEYTPNECITTVDINLYLVKPILMTISANNGIRNKAEKSKIY